jgi:hypothetical protein
MAAGFIVSVWRARQRVAYAMGAALHCRVSLACQFNSPLLLPTSVHVRLCLCMLERVTAPPHWLHWHGDRWCECTVAAGCVQNLCSELTPAVAPRLQQAPRALGIRCGVEASVLYGVWLALLWNPLSESHRNSGGAGGVRTQPGLKHGAEGGPKGGLVVARGRLAAVLGLG